MRSRPRAHGAELRPDPQRRVLRGARRAGPDRYLGIEGPTFAARVAGVISQAWVTCWPSERPDRLLVLGDTDSGLSALVAKRLGIRVFHMEAGNRCFDDRVPEEVNRRVIDQSSDVLMPYTERSRANLLARGHRVRLDLRHRQSDQGGDGPSRRGDRGAPTSSNGSASRTANTWCSRPTGRRPSTSKAA